MSHIALLAYLDTLKWEINFLQSVNLKKVERNGLVTMAKISTPNILPSKILFQKIYESNMNAKILKRGE